MLRTTMLFAIACLMIATMFPGVAAAPEVDTEAYGSVGGGGTDALYVGIFAPPSMGGAVLSVNDPHSLVIIDVLDNAFQFTGSQTCAGASAVVTASSGAPAAAGCAEPACGTYVFAPTTPVNNVTVFVYGAFVDATLQACFGFAGTVTAVFD